MVTLDLKVGKNLFSNCLHGQQSIVEGSTSTLQGLFLFLIVIIYAHHPEEVLIKLFLIQLHISKFAELTKSLILVDLQVSI